MSSLLGRRWREVAHLETHEDVFAKLLQKQGLGEHEAISAFLNPSVNQLHDPFLLHSMEQAVKRILSAIETQERIMVFGDFDTDGIASTVILVDGIKNLGGAVSYRIPDRGQDSHGLKKHHVDEMAQKKVSLIVTCDCGTNDRTEIEYAKKLGIDVIVTDHHETRKDQFPTSAVAVINPKLAHCAYPEKNLAGAGVAFKLISALAEKTIDSVQEMTSFLEKYLEICALGTIADCVDLTGEVRVLTYFGLAKMKRTQWDGLAKMFEKMGVVPENISAETIAYYVAPKLNAASRIGDVMRAVQLFLGDPERNFERLTYLERLNEERKRLTQKAISEATTQLDVSRPIQILTQKHWKVGILGLIASNLVEKINQPIVAIRSETDVIKGSCRAPEGVSIIKALQSCDKGLFTHFGGHDGAAGFVAPRENLESIQDQLNAYFQKNKAPEQTLEATAFLSPSLLSFTLTEFLSQLSPFGAGNDEPIWGLRDLEIRSMQAIGKEKNHLKIRTFSQGVEFDFIGFFLGEWKDRLQIGTCVDVLFTLSENFFRGERQLQLKLVDIRARTP